MLSARTVYKSGTCPSDGNYVVIRPRLTIGGCKLQLGDLLPEDSAIRKQPRKLETMCRLRRLMPQIASAKMQAVDVLPSKKVAKEADLGTLSLQELKQLCRDKGLPPYGNKSQLRKRLHSVVE